MYGVMFANLFTDLKSAEKSWIGFLMKDSSTQKLSFVEWLLMETSKKLFNEQQVRRINGIRKEPDINVPGHALSASDGLYQFINKKMNELKIKPFKLGEINEANIGEKIYEGTRQIPQTLLDSGEVVLYLPTGMVIEYHKYLETMYGGNVDYKSNIMYVKEFTNVKIIPVPNAAHHRRLIWSLEGNLHTAEFIPGAMFNYKIIEQPFGVAIESHWNEGFFALITGKKYFRKQDMNFHHQFIFVSDKDYSERTFLPIGKDEATPSALFHNKLISVPNSVLTAITNILDVEVGGQVTIKEGSDAFGIKIDKSGNFSEISSDWVPSVGDSITLAKRADGKFIEVIRTNASSDIFEFPDDVTTPSVAGATEFRTSENTQPTTITNLTDGIVGENYIIYGNGSGANSSVINNGGNFVLTGTMTLESGKSITLVLSATDNKWHEVTRAV
jgi:hypothetical protein